VAEDPPPPLVRTPSPEAPIWASRTWVLSGDHGLAWPTGTSVGWWQIRDDEGTTSYLRLRASLDNFVTDHLSLGFTAGFTAGNLQYVEGGGRIGTAFTALPGVSSVWPRLSYVVAIFEGGTVHTFQAYIPAVGHAMPHFFFGIGPAYERVEARPSGSASSATHAFGILFSLGGYWRRAD
jgi:hypothetical protein